MSETTVRMASPDDWAAVAGLLVVAALAVVVLTGHGRAPFAAAVGIALLNVVLLVVTL